MILGAGEVTPAAPVAW